MKIVIALSVIGAVAAASPAGATDPRVHHGVRHHSRRPHAHYGAQGHSLMLVPPEHPGYRYGGPLYSTCDRINADRMLVGTCR